MSDFMNLYDGIKIALYHIDEHLNGIGKSDFKGHLLCKLREHLEITLSLTDGENEVSIEQIQAWASNHEHDLYEE